jgi:hypothetical protein
MRQAFKKFGPYLKDPQTDIKLYVPRTLPTIHEYNNKESHKLPEKQLEESWYGRLTQSNLFKTCIICGSSLNVEMHHLRKAKNVRVKMANNTASFDQ